MYKIFTTPTFDNDIKKIGRDVTLRIIKKIEWLGEHPEFLRFSLKHLPHKLKGLQKYRMGDYRVLLWVDHRKKIITLYAVEHRRSIYKRI